MDHPERRPWIQARRHRRFGIPTLMSDAGLTNGAFYVHFASKEDLVATTVADHYAHSARASARWRPATPELSNTHGHLTVQHRDTPTAALRRPARRNRTLHRRNQARLHRRRTGHRR
jgi:AcrR family transcriptional regulator